LKKLCSCLLLLFSAYMISGQTPNLGNLGSVSNAFKNFAVKIAPVLSGAAFDSLVWSDSCIGRFGDPTLHFGAGVSIQSTFIPIDGIDPLLNALDLASPQGLTAFGSLGVPFPSYAIEARIGGMNLPFDIGVKGGAIFADGKTFNGNASVDYMMLGTEIRYAILNDMAGSFGLSVGLGFTWLKGGVYVPMSDIVLSNVPTGPSRYDSVTLTKPNMALEWSANVFELKVQASKTLGSITPYFGFGGSLNWTEAGGGFYSQNGLKIGGVYMDAEQLSYLQQHFPGSPSNASISQNTILAKYRQAAVWGLSVFGGLSFKLGVARLDLNAMFNVPANVPGVDVGLRLQF